MSSDIRPQIESANAQFVSAFKRGDATAIANLRGKYLVVWKNDSDKWKLHRDIWTTSQPPPAS